MNIQQKKEEFLSVFENLSTQEQEEVIDFTYFLKTKQNNSDSSKELNQEIQHLLSNSNSFEFLSQEEDIYSLSDAQEVYS
ncbi:MAG TPA: hypothetical protein DCM02_07000 [Flavobacterium sp.]|nr:hypothetical protein [Flavobacterium sp.]